MSTLDKQQAHGPASTSETRDILLTDLLVWEGALKNARLRALFGLSTVRASQWLRAFRDNHKAWLEWDTLRRCFVATKAVYAREGGALSGEAQQVASLARYLSSTRVENISVDANNGASGGQAIWSAFPDLAVPVPAVFAALHDAIRRSLVVEITYRSMRNPAPHGRIISPHSLVRVGRRWHVRAYSDNDSGYSDYALSRIEKLKVTQASQVHGRRDDVAWMTFVPVRLVAHPNLTEAQKGLISFEYFAGTAARVTRCRAALVNYFVQDVHAAIDTRKQVPPEFQLAVENTKEVSRWLFPT